MENYRKQEFLDSLSERIHDIDERIIELKEWLHAEEYHANRSDAEKLLIEMEKYRDSLQLKYNEIQNDENYDEYKMKELDRNIYTSITSFRDSFLKAGGIFRGTGSARRRYI